MWIPVWTSPTRPGNAQLAPLGNTGSRALAGASQVLWCSLIENIHRHGGVVSMGLLLDEMVERLLGLCPREASSWQDLIELWRSDPPRQAGQGAAALEGALRDMVHNHWELARTLPGLDEGSLEESLRMLVLRWLIERHRACTPPEQAWFECSGGLVVLLGGRLDASTPGEAQ